MVFNSIPQFPWSSSRTPHPTERNDFCIFTPNCPIWKKNICKDCKVNPLTNPPISPTQANQPPALWIVTKHTEKNAFHKTRHYKTIHAGGRQQLNYSWATSLCAEESLIATRCKRPEFKSCKTKPAQTPFLASLGCVTSKPFLKNVGMVYDDTANKCSPPKKIREIFHYIM